MFTTPMFYIGLVIIALLPLTVAIVAPQKVRYKIIASVCSRCCFRSHVRNICGKRK